jgi:hypothetical protein
MTRVFLFAVCAAAGLVCASCDEKLSSITGPTPDLAPTFTSIQQNIFTATDPSGRAACTNCHTTAGGRVPPVGMDLGSGSAHAQLVNVPSRGKPGAVRVIPGDPDNSYLIHKLAGLGPAGETIAGVRMPLGAGPYLTEGQIRVIRRWIELGALNN